MTGFFARIESKYKATPGLVILEDPGIMARVAVGNGLFTLANSIFLVVVFLANGEAPAGWLTLGVVAIYAIATGFFALTGRADIYVHLMLWPSLLFDVAIVVALGGLVWSGGFIMWGLVVSVAGALFLSRRPAIVLAAGYIVSALALAVLEPALRSLRERPEPRVSTIAMVDVFAIGLLIIVPIVMLLMAQIGRERSRSEGLLLNVLPRAIADRLKQAPGIIADAHEVCSVLFADIVGFTEHASRVSPERLISELNLVFSRFDGLVELCGAEKIKTMGDGYLAVAGVPRNRPDHALVMCDLALKMQAAMPSINDELGTGFLLRVGLSSGRLVAGVVGTQRFSYDLWGDTVNLASRMEGLSEPGGICATESVVSLTDGAYRFEYGGLCDVKGIGPTATYRLVGAAVEPETVPVS